MKKSFILFIGIFSILLSACTANKYVYSPVTANLLQLEEKKDVKLAANYSAAGDLSGGGTQNQTRNGLDIQSAFAVSDKIALKLDGFYKWESNESTNNGTNSEMININYKKRGVELSGGYYNLSDKKMISKFSLYLGLGLGKLDLRELNVNISSANYFHSMSYAKLFFQPSFSIRVNKNYTTTLAVKLSSLKYYNIKTDYPDLSQEPLGFIDKKLSYFGDFIFQNEFGFSKLKGFRFQTQLGVTKLYTRFPSTSNSLFRINHYDYNNGWFMIGVIADMKKILLKK